MVAISGHEEVQHIMLGEGFGQWSCHQLLQT